ncbi:hypothetical protein [Herbaspirillum sp. YR522]|uniref:hypothetical protein n=1 Tax=Herbaspirillum sp. YR522 TaxID=1144342 RepID=UPI0012F84E2B|nr:hypothetical protein [Herbaspirillum sp. YR522]
MTLKFNDLLVKAFLDWPQEIDLNPLVKGGDERYSIKGLGQMSDAISKGYIGTSEEVMLRNLHDAIYEVLHGVAAYTTRIKISELRPEAIRIRFERRLQNALKMPELGYLSEDIKLVKRYFSTNEK